ncbi:hypothetical protein EBZ37_12840, partial [bacterium]|nr:hypothetical protein [bacterium]
KAAAAPTEVPKAQEAHECIRPTHMDAPTLTGAGAAAGQQEKWNEQDHKLYGLIWRRAVQSLMSAARGKRRTVLATMDEDPDKFQWSSTVSKTDFEGWKILGATAQLDTEDEEESQEGKGAAWSLATSLTQGTALTWATIQAQPTYTRAKPRFTEATLVRELEGKGIGRPSTFASLLETLQDKGYVEKKTIAGTQVQTTTLLLHPNEWPPSKQSGSKTLGAEKDKLVPTPLGHSVATFCSSEFPGLFAYSFTAEMEAGLDSIAKGDLPWKQLCNKTWDSYKDVYTAQKAEKGNKGANSAKLRDFGGGLKAILSKKGALIVQEAQKEGDKPSFYPFPEGATIQNITEEQVRAAIKAKEAVQVGSNEYGTLDGEPIVKKKGPYGFYVDWKGLRCPVAEGESRDAILTKLQARLLSKDKDHTVGPYTFRVGQYG